MACVITLDGKEYNEAGFKQLLASGLLVNEINSGVLADSKSGIYKQYINGNGTQEATSGEAQQAATQGQEAQGAGTEAGQTTPGTETANQIPGFDQLTTAQQQRFNSALDEINQSLDNKVSAREAFNKLMSYLGPDNIPFIVNMRAAIETSLDESRVSNLLKSLNKAGKTQIKGKLARTKVGQSLLNLSGSMKSLGFSMAVLSDEDFDNFVKEAYGLSATGQNALYAWGAKTMVLRASNTSQIALHEFTHPLLEIIEKTDPAAYASLVAEVRTIDSQEGTIHPEGMKFFEWAQKNYDRGTTETLDNEALTELVSVLADRRVSLSSPVGQAAHRVWNKIMAFFKLQATIDVKIDNTLTIDKLAKAISLAAITSRTIRVTNAAGINVVTKEGIASSRNTDLIADAGISRYMTEDGEGNYVFYHRSNLDLTKKGIDPNKLGSNMRTGRDETMAKYPVSMYYTEPDIADVSGDYNHVVMIPKEKVYPADVDPLNLKPLAEKEFRKVFPNIAFDNNRAVSWIGKVAADQGYEMVVASWSPRRNFKALRAESVIKHKPKLFVKPSSGLGYSVDVNEKYEFTSNRKSVKKSMEASNAPGVVASGRINKRGISQNKVASTPAVSVYESKDVVNLEVKTLDDLYNQYDGKAVVINSDPTRVGELKLPSGKVIFMYGGPGYLSLKDNVDGNVGFATTQINKVNTWSKYTKKLFGNKKSLTFVATQTPLSMVSNSYALRYVMDAISTLPKSVLKSSEFKSEFFGKDLLSLKAAFGDKGYNDFISRYKNADLSDPAIIDRMISEMAYKVGDDNNPASFKARRAFVLNLLAGINSKSKSKSAEGDVGYYSKSPQKFIAKKLYEKHGLNVEKLMYELGEKEVVDLYMKEGKWGLLVSGFETDPGVPIESVQTKGVKHPLFNAKFPSSNAFLLDGAYEVDNLFEPIEIETEKGGLYTKKASIMLSSSMYVKGEKKKSKGSFGFSNVKPLPGKGISSSRSAVKFDEKKFNAEPVIEEMKSIPVESDGGATINLDGSKYEGGGLVVPIGSRNFKASELTKEAVVKFIEDNLGKISGDAYKFGFYKFEGQDKISVDINVVVDPKYKDLGLKFGKMAGQKSLFNLDTMQEDETGADGSNPMSFTDEQARAIGEAFSRGEFPSSVFGEAGTTDVTSKFAESAKLFDQIQEAEGSAKKRRLAEERRNLIESSPEVKFIDDNIKNIYEQLENKGVLKREGNCP
jgi:hypothetical protein